jgi:hypothetical protein
MTDFALTSVLDAARRAIEEHQRLELSVRDTRAFVEALLDPTLVNDASPDGAPLPRSNRREGATGAGEPSLRAEVLSPQHNGNSSRSGVGSAYETLPSRRSYRKTVRVTLIAWKRLVGAAMTLDYHW